MKKQHSSSEKPNPSGYFVYGILIIVLAAAVSWAYLPVIQNLFLVWSTDQNYSVGQLVPLIALWFLWHDRKKLQKTEFRYSLWGIAALIFAQVVRFSGILFTTGSLEWFGFLATIWGLTLLLMGPKAFFKLKWILLFLVLMFPLPRMIHFLVSNSLQSISTSSAVFLLELLHSNIKSEGNVIILNDTMRVGVIEACNGLRMLTAFIVVASVFAYMVDRPRWQKLTLLISSVPVAIICNIVRLFITSELYLYTSSETAEKFFHDFAGITMMPTAIIILILEMAFLNKLIIPEEIKEMEKHPKN
jgi:exosortase